MNLNSDYLVIFRSFRDQSFIKHLAYQIRPENSYEIVKIFNEATSKAYSPILFDLRQSTSNLLRYRCNFDQDKFSTCYCTQEFLNSCDNHEKINNQQTFVTHT